MIRYGVAALTLAADLTAGTAQAAPTIEGLLKDGWEIVGLAGNYDVRTSLLLFRKKDVTYLVQCSTLYDVTRDKRVVVNCYELH